MNIHPPPQPPLSQPPLSQPPLFVGFTIEMGQLACNFSFVQHFVVMCTETNLMEKCKLV